ncbi:GGDEF domain-containing protein [Agrobacterium rosae]|uniref:diguanylate cyclase n=1 Tax=Agrobacterium rosae TaxID=1972867 RepID=A0A1R3U3Y7_9HYPH|nr:GGDEF domain-containing protein [Agrobacterium rosae]SCX35372.1 Stalked cell differentiation-controlling protein [Agrobacterium rosae]
MDINTLLFASVAARGGFILIFLIASVKSEARIAFRLWTISIFGSATGILLFYGDPHYPYYLAGRGWLIYTIIGLSLSCMWAGGRAFFGYRVNKAAFAVIGFVPGLVYGGARTGGMLPDTVLLLTIATLVVAMAVVSHPFLSRRGRRFLPSQLLVGVSLATYSAALFTSFVLVVVRLFVSGVAPDPQASDISLALFIDQLMSVLIYVGLVAMSLEHVQMRMKQLATIDPLTGLANRRGVQEQTAAVIDACRRARRPMAVLIADLDHFKSINDQYGHDCGDMVLQEFGNRLSSHSRRGQDVTGRWGGEEFLAVLSDMTLAEAVSFADRLCLRVAQEPFDLGDQKITVTVSIGVASIDCHASSLDKAVRAADEALYEAKRNGRNRAHSAEPIVAPAFAQAM